MSNKTYTLILNSSIATNVNTSGGLSAYTYYVNWGSFLPRSVKRFSIQAVFRSNANSIPIDETALIYANFGSRELYDQTSSRSNLVTIAQPDSYITSTANAPRYYYNTYDSPKFMATYPSNDFITIRITRTDGTTPIATNQINNYVLTLSFTEIPE